MKNTRTLVCWAYGLIALAALVLTWTQNLAFFKAHPGFSFADFWTPMKANQLSRSITIDLAFFLLAAALFMISEARRLKIRFVWLYLLAGYLVAISVAFPVFMIMRERAMTRAGETDAGFTITDLITTGATAVIMIGLVCNMMRRPDACASPGAL